MKKFASQAAFIEQTLANLADAIEHANAAEAAALERGFLQRLDPRAKLCGILLLVLASVASRSLAVTAAMLLFACVLAWASKISLRSVVSRVWPGVFFFTGAIALPAIFITPGPVLWRLPLLGWPVAATGLQSASQLVLRAETSATLVFLLVLSTPWTDVLKALRSLRVPVVAVMILGMTHRFIFLLLHLAREQFEARRSRLVGRLDAAQARRIAASSAGVLLGKSMQLSGDVYLAMQARGFRGEFTTLHEFKMLPRDWISLAGFAGVAGLAWQLGARL